jgi:hypothetical protein
VFGILTTYKDWRLCWLPNTSSAAKSPNVESEPTATSIDELDVIPVWDDDYQPTDDDEEEEVGVSDDQDNREFIVTETMGPSNPDLPLYLVSVILKMYASPHSRVQLVDPKRPYIMLNENNWSWVRFNKDLNVKKVGYNYFYHLHILDANIESKEVYSSTRF